MSAFEDFIQRYQDMVYTTAARLLGDGAQAEDVAQDAFLKAWERFAELELSPTAGGWLKTVATNLALNELTRHRARWKLFSELERDEAPVDFAEPPAAPREFSDEELERALAALPEHQRVPLLLFHYEDMSYESIAKKLGVSLSKLKTDIFRARAALRRSLESA